MMMHVGMKSLCSKFRVDHGLSGTWKEGSNIIEAREVPFAYIWSPALVPKPLDWGTHIDVVGFSELEGSGFSGPPPADIDAWIKKEPRKIPIFIGFGSCVLPNVRKVGETIYDAAKMANVRVIIQQGWAGLGKDLKGLQGVSFVNGAKGPDGGVTADELDLKANDFCLVIGRVAHSWLFEKVAGVVHHGGAGTTYAGLKAARPTLIAPFFGDQPFWGQMVNNAGAGPKPTAVESWRAKTLAEAFLSMFTKEQKKAALLISKAFKRENGAREAVRIFHEKMLIGQLECDLLQTDVARYYVPNWRLKLGIKGFVIMRKHQPEWHKILMGKVHRYKTCDWNLATMSSMGEEVKQLDLSQAVTSKEVEVALRNLKAIMDARGQNHHSKDLLDVIHPDPRIRL
ncbi:hypothetical protein AAMO2058_001577600 [Amorphochlora amoebiformis]